MTIHAENNEKTKVIKDSLAVLLKKLENKKQIIAARKSYIYIEGKQVPYIPRDKLELLNITTSILINLISQFNSVDDLGSVKKLRETELFFLKKDALSEFKFPDYKPQIHSSFLIYADIDLQLEKLEKQANDLASRGHNLASSEAKSIVTLLRPLNHTFFKERRIGFYDYNARASEIINQSRPLLEQHRGYKKILGNLLLLLCTLGIAHIGNKLVNKHFVFFRETESSKQLNQLDHMMSKLDY